MRVRIVSDLDEMKDLEEDWERIRKEAGAPVLNSFHIISCWLKHQDESCQPRILVMERGGMVHGIVPLTIFRYNTGRFPMRTLRLAGNGFKMPSLFHLQPMLKKEDNDSLDLAVKGMRKTHCQTLFMRYLEDVPAVQALLHRLSQSKMVSQQRSEICPLMQLNRDPSSRDETIWRSERRARSRLDKEGRLSFHQVRTVEEAEKAMQIYVEQHIERWTNKGGSVMSDPATAQYLIQLGKTVVEKKQGFIFEALIDGEVAGQHLVFAEGKSAYMYRIGVNERYLSYSPGHLASAFSISQLRLKGFTSLDLGPGKEPYKMEMGALAEYVITANGLGPSMRFLSKVSKLPLVRNVVGRLGIQQTMLEEVNRF
jgi:CelD/BcsL family acetyltransferase involved in cellulose biosynthesis